MKIYGNYKVIFHKCFEYFIDLLPRIDEIFASLQEEKLFTTLELSNAYNQLVLNIKSRLFCTCSSHIGLFKVKRFPFGVTIATAFFQVIMENLLLGIEIL